MDGGTSSLTWIELSPSGGLGVLGRGAPGHGGRFHSNDVFPGVSGVVLPPKQGWVEGWVHVEQGGSAWDREPD